MKIEISSDRQRPIYVMSNYLFFNQCAQQALRQMAANEPVYQNQGFEDEENIYVNDDMNVDEGICDPDVLDR